MPPRSTILAMSRLLPLTLLLLLPFAPLGTAQVGTLLQDINTAPAFGIQKECARDCMVDELGGGSCPRDAIGEAIGCSTWKCNKEEWSMNDCYCRPDLQGPAQSYISKCVSSSCSVGNKAIDASTAGSIYSQYCVDKGYIAPTAPQVVTASATAASGDQRVTKSFSGVAAATGTGTAADATKSSSSMPISTIIGIAVGGFAALVITLWIIKWLYRWCAAPRPPKPTADPYMQQPPPSYMPPVYPPMKPFEQPYYPAPQSELGNLGPELRPEDSMSVIGNERPAPLPSLLSAGNGYQGDGFQRFGR